MAPVAVVVATALMCGVGVSAEAAVRKPTPAQVASAQAALRPASPSGGIGALDIAANAAGDVTLSFDAGESLDHDVLGLLVAQMQARNPRLSDTIKQDLETHKLDVPDTGTQGWVDFNATIVATPTGVDIVFPESEVRAEARWWQQIIAVLSGIALQLFSRTLCIG